jgi:S-adenosylmethionine synthetase
MFPFYIEDLALHILHVTAKRKRKEERNLTAMDEKDVYIIRYLQRALQHRIEVVVIWTREKDGGDNDQHRHKQTHPYSFKESHR